MKIQELEAQLLALTPSEKAQVIQLLTQNLANTWQGVSFRHLGMNESQLLDNYPTLTATDLANAWAYAAAFPDEIEIAIRENDED
jgi:uncharacterized protein YqjF (DUF2071 family)